MTNLRLNEETAKVLSSDTRKEIIKLLDERNMTVTELSRKLDLSKSTVHEHLNKLLDAKFVNKLDEEGKKWVYYELTKKGKDVVGNRVKQVLLFASSAVAGVIGIQQLYSYFETGYQMKESADPGTMTEEATGVAETTAEATSGNIHLAAAVILFAVVAVLLLYYYKKMR
ncbi:MAG: winged helix-turn-helix domain-containing protein [Candidatus Aenigmatarchaeota archaeon]